MISRNLSWALHQAAGTYLEQSQQTDSRGHHDPSGPVRPIILPDDRHGGTGHDCQRRDGQGEGKRLNARPDRAGSLDSLKVAADRRVAGQRR